MPGLCHRIGSAGMVLAALVAFGSGAAQAAPQVLALIATNGKVDLVREGRTCSAELTSFCLDAGRFSPAPGTAYHLAGAADVRLVGTAADGRSLSLDPQAFLRFGHLIVDQLAVFEGRIPTKDTGKNRSVHSSLVHILDMNIQVIKPFMEGNLGQRAFFYFKAITGRHPPA